MKTKEFIEEARDLGLFVEENKNQNMIWIKTPYEDSHVGEVKTNKIGCRIFDESKGFPGISKLIYEYGMTPLEEREEEKKYIYRLAVPDAIGGFYALRTNGEQDDLRVGGTIYERYKEIDSYHFTDKEVEQFTGKERALFNVCEKIEVSP